MAAYRERYGADGMFDVTVYEGVPEALDELTGRGDVLAVTTSKPVVYAREIVAHLGLAEAFAGGVHGAALDGSVEGKSAVVGLALAQHGDGPGDGPDRRPPPRRRGRPDRTAWPASGCRGGSAGARSSRPRVRRRVVDKPAEIAAALDAL